MCDISGEFPSKEMIRIKRPFCWQMCGLEWAGQQLNHKPTKVAKKFDSDESHPSK
jgi:hypothetical protein